MTRTLLLTGLALCFAVPAFAQDRGKVDEKMEDVQRDLNQGKRKAAKDELKAEQARTGDSKLTSLNVELRNKLGDDWTVKKSGNGYLATRVAPKKADDSFGKKVGDQIRDLRSGHSTARATRTGDAVMLHGRIDDCASAAKAADDFASINGVNKIYVDLSCSSMK